MDNVLAEQILDVLRRRDPPEAFWDSWLRIFLANHRCE
jgi:hypothetical protein